MTPEGTQLRDGSRRSTRFGRHRPFPIIALAVAVVLVGAACASGASSATTAVTTRPPDTTVRQPDVAGTFDVGGGRKMYMQCSGQGSPTVILISGGGIAGDVWDSPLGKQPTVYPSIAKTTRVCAYDRPGTTRAVAGGGLSRSDPVPQPVTPSASAADLHALLAAAGQTGPFVLAAHSYGGLVARYFAHEYPTDVAGMVLIDSFSPELREAMPTDLWPSWIVWNTPATSILQDYPDYERVDYDKALDEVAASRSIPPMPLVVLTADQPYPAPTQPGLPANLNTVTRQAQDVSQRQVAQLVPGASTSPRPTAATTSCSRTQCWSPMPSARSSPLCGKPHQHERCHVRHRSDGGSGGDGIS